MDRSEKIKRTIVEAIGNPDGKPGVWQVTTFTRMSAEAVAETIYEALKAKGYLAENLN